MHNDKIRELRSHALAASDYDTVDLCNRALSEDVLDQDGNEIPYAELSREEARQACKETARYERMMVAQNPYLWAKHAVPGDYLIFYEDTGLTADQDPGSRCGYDDQELDAISQILELNGYTLEADDCGLICALEDS